MLHKKDFYISVVSLPEHQWCPSLLNSRFFNWPNYTAQNIAAVKKVICIDEQGEQKSSPMKFHHNIYLSLFLLHDLKIFWNCQLPNRRVVGHNTDRCITTTNWIQKSWRVKLYKKLVLLFGVFYKFDCCASVCVLLKTSAQNDTWLTSLRLTNTVIRVSNLKYPTLHSNSKAVVCTRAQPVMKAGNHHKSTRPASC